MTFASICPDNCGFYGSRQEVQEHKCADIYRERLARISKRLEQTIESIEEERKNRKLVQQPKMQNIDYSTMKVSIPTPTDRPSKKDRPRKKETVYKVGDIFMSNASTPTRRFKLLSIDSVNNFYAFLELVTPGHTYESVYTYDRWPKWAVKVDDYKTENPLPCANEQKQYAELPHYQLGKQFCSACNLTFNIETLVDVKLPSGDRQRFCQSCWSNASFNKEPIKGQTNKETFNSWDPEDDTFLEDA